MVTEACQGRRVSQNQPRADREIGVPGPRNPVPPRLLVSVKKSQLAPFEGQQFLLHGNAAAVSCQLAV